MSSPAQRRPVDLPASPVVRLLAPSASYSLRGDLDVMRAAGTVIGTTPSEVACRAVAGPAWNALWLGPDEQMLVGPLDDQARFETALAAALHGRVHSLVDVSHRQVALEVAGPQAATLLNCACPLDLDLQAFPVGTVTRTVFAKAEIVLWRQTPDLFRIDAWRSYASYLTTFLDTAARIG